MPKLEWSGTQRVRYYNGQLLAARDLQDDVAYELRMRGLHVRALHNTWGIALGFRLDLSNDRRQVLVGPGLAYDCWGREILLAETLSLDGPVRPAGSAGKSLVFDLVMRYRDVAARSEAQKQAVCLGSSTGRAEERPTVRWAFAGEADGTSLARDVRLGEEIPIGRFISMATAELSEPDLGVRRNAQPLLRPHIAFGVSRPGELTWNQTDFGLATDVDTHAGGFSTTPFYFATLAQNPWFDNLDPQIVGPFMSIAQPRQTRFQLQLLFAAWTRPTDAPPGFMARANQASIFWVGVEPVSGCQPGIRFDWFFTLAGHLIRQPSSGWSEAIGRLMQMAFT